MKSDSNPYCKCLFYSANALARTVTRMAEEEFSVVHLAPSYAFIVMTINKNPGIHSGELAEIMKLAPSTLTRLLDKLIGQEMIKKHIEGRTSFIYPTKKALDLNEDIKSAWMKLYQRFNNELGSDFSATLTDDIFKAVVRLDKK